MLKNFTIAILGAAALIPGAALASGTMGYNLHLTVPVHCMVNQKIAGSSVAEGQSLSLGVFREYCNAPSGYQLIVKYTPGTLQGAKLVAGNDQITLDGSGQAVLSRATGPKIRERAIYLTPGQNGVDASSIDLDIVPV